jgi:hypothetical protein
MREESDIVDSDNSTFEDISFGLSHMLNFEDGSSNQ